MLKIINDTDKELVSLEHKYGADTLSKCADYEYLCHLLTECEDDIYLDSYSAQEISRCLSAVKKELCA